MRLAIGATRGRLIRQYLTESVLLAAGGSVIGLGLACLGVWALARAALLEPDFRFRLSLFVLVSCAGLTLLTIILSGLAPAFRATRLTLAESMKEGGLATQTISRSRLSKLLVSNQIALSLTLLVLASLLAERCGIFNALTSVFSARISLSSTSTPPAWDTKGSGCARFTSNCWNGRARLQVSARPRCRAWPR